MEKQNQVWDPLRRKEVALTPEERVRQWFISTLHSAAGVPLHQMMSEVELSWGSAGKKYRADIVVYASGGRPLAVVECKRPDVILSRDVLEQALRYDMVLDVRYLFITNGNETRVFRRSGECWQPSAVFPSYEAMSSGQ